MAKWETEVVSWGLLSRTDACPKCLSTSLFFSIVWGHFLPSAHAEAIPCQLCKTCISTLFWFCPEKLFLSMPASWLESHAIPPNIFYFVLLFFPHSFTRHWVVDKGSILKNLTHKCGNSVQGRKVETTFYILQQHVFCSHSNVLPTTSNFCMQLSDPPPRDTEDGTMYSMLLPTAWIRWILQAPMMSATSRHGLLAWRI